MKITVNKEQIIEGLLKAVSIIPAKSGTQYLRSIWLQAEQGKIAIMGTDANIEFTGKYDAIVEEEGIVGVQGRAFVDLVRQLPSGQLHLALDASNGNLQLRQGKRRYTLPISNAEWFQSFSVFPEENSVMWSGDFFQEILDRVTFCISDDDPMEAINCLCLRPCGNGRMDICGLNGHQFALVSFMHDTLAGRLAGESILIQKKYIQDIKKWLSPDEIELNINEKRLYLRNLDKTEMLSVPRSVHDYPDYGVFMGRLEGENVRPLRIERKELMDALGRILIFNTDQDRCTYLDLQQTEIHLSAQGQDVGTANESMAADYSGAIERIAFPTRNLLDILGHFNSQNLEMLLTDAEGPCGIRGTDDAEYTVIIMPMKIYDTNNDSYEDDV
ncbi:MAG: DNA polymerase III subunit beta [Desulfovibrio sp.]|nr:DNA polymerase III subunit beta [Desulfovibrio sp.]